MHLIIPSNLKPHTRIHPLMKIAIMQPYFLPYLGYYSLIKNVDGWIFNDEVQMIHKGWVQRNRILKQHGGWHYIRVPLVKHQHTEIIKNIFIRNDEEWKRKILAQIKHYKRRAPYFYKVNSFLEDAFKETFETITEQNAHLIKKTCDYIGLDFEYEILSEMNLDIGEIIESDDWSLNICNALKVDHYINPILGKQFYNTEKFEASGIKINFLNKKINTYDQKKINGDFIEDLSIIDVMMFNSPEDILESLNNYTLE